MAQLIPAGQMSRTPKSKLHRAATVPQAEWQHHKSAIMALYNTHTLGEVMEIMKEEHDFSASWVYYLQIPSFGV